MDLDGVLKGLFLSWRPYGVIRGILKEKYGVSRSIRWLKYQFKRLNLRRRGNNTPRQHIVALIKDELRSANRLLGYRSMWKLLRDKYRILAKRDTVMAIMKQLDPSGVRRRRKRRLRRRIYRNKGPNEIWHIDGYDKLSPYGLTIHGCIDGFSRCVLWLKLAPTNSNPKVVARYYLEQVETVGGCPSVVRCDYGTENISIASTQIAFRFYHTDSRAGDRSFIYGPSKANIRIEGWWSQLRRLKTTWWIDLCKTLSSNGQFNGRINFHKWCLAYCFVPALEADLSEFMNLWNTHLIRRNRLADCPSGVPKEMYETPGLVESDDVHNSASDCLKPVTADVWVRAYVVESSDAPPFFPSPFKLWADEVIENDFNITQECITSTMCKYIYLHLISQNPPTELFE